jgi:hypothetical protein
VVWLEPRLLMIHLALYLFVPLIILVAVSQMVFRLGVP